MKTITRSTSRPRLSVVVPTYRRPEEVGRCIKSILAQDIASLEILVIDDNDDSGMRSETGRTILSLRDPRVNYLANERSKGGCGARNTGILRASGELIAFLDDDDELVSGGLSAQLARIESSEGAVLCFGTARVVDEAFGRKFLHRPMKDELSFGDIISGACPPTSSVVVARREALISAGLFDETLPSFQDFDMWLRVSRVGRIVGHGSVVAQFTQHGGDRTSTNLDRRLHGLDRICSKWNSEFRLLGNMDEFRARFESRLYLENGQRLLASGLRCRPRALSLMFQAFQAARSRKAYYFGRLLLGCLGYNLTRVVLRVRDAGS